MIVLNLESPECEAGILITTPQFSVNFILSMKEFDVTWHSMYDLLCHDLNAEFYVPVTPLLLYRAFIAHLHVSSLKVVKVFSEMWN
jgi:hypothetical protein